jgi:dihydrofolate reductase
LTTDRGFTVIAAVDEAGGIGRGGQLPWRLKADMDFFRRTTTGPGGGAHAVILGRKTWESLPAAYRPLPGRRNLVVTRQPGFRAAGADIAASLDAALIRARAGGGAGEVFVIGGAEIYTAALAHPDCGRILITCVAGRHDCDAFFPRWSELLLVRQGPEMQEGELRYSFCEFAPPAR